MLVDLIGAAPAPLLVAAVAVYAAAILHLAGKDIERARWQKEFGGWRRLQHDRILGRFAPPAIPFLPALLASVTRPRTVRTDGSGWRAVQRHRIARRRCDRAVW